MASGAPKKYQIFLTNHAIEHLKAITDQRVASKIGQVISRLEVEPEKQGKPLTDDLARYRSIRAVGQRYRIVYRVHEDTVEVVVVTVGIRREGSRNDVYELPKKLLALGILEPDM